MNRLNFSDVAQTLIDQDAIEPPPRDYVLYKMDVSYLYDLPLNSGYAFAYYAVSPSDYQAGYEYIEKYIGTHWPFMPDKRVRSSMADKWVNDHAIDLMLNRATQVHRIDQLDENDVVPTFKKWLEGV